jgi:hypothetical protein
MLGPYRFIPVVLLLGAAAALLVDRSKLPIALRGLEGVLGRAPREGDKAHRVPAWRRWLAFALVAAAFLTAVA